MEIKDFHYDLPQDLIGQKPTEPRDACKLIVLDREKENISHHIFKDILDLLNEKCVLVLNDTKVFPARLVGKKTTGGKAEVLLLRQIESDTYMAIGKGGLKAGQEIIFSDRLKAKIQAKNFDGDLRIQFNVAGAELFRALDESGHTPLPPYIHSSDPESVLRQEYQTVYADIRGSAAAPTAGLHFTDQLLMDLKTKGVEVEKITLHVGLGTFRPVTDEQIQSHKLHTENFTINEETATRLNQAKKDGKKIIAVGTTSCRVLESQATEEGLIASGSGDTNIFIQPGYKYKFVDGLITNFHLPETSLLMLVSALCCSPNTKKEFTTFLDTLVGKAYLEAIKNEYKFFSFGDAMLII